MKRNIEDYYRTVNALIKAYFNDTLCAVSCRACACGNIAAEYLGYKVVAHKSYGDFFWTKDGKEVTPIYARGVWFRAPTPYTGDEIDTIEDRFMNPHRFGYGESTDFARDRDQYHYNGLCAVVDYLGELYGVDDSVENFKQKFLELKEEKLSLQPN